MVRFLVRNPIRDRWKDYMRMQKLVVVLGTIAADITKEKAGLRQRYDAAMAEAAFSMDALDDPNMPPPPQGGVEGMAGSLDRYAQRIAELEEQIAFFDDVQGTVQRFMRERGIDTVTQN